MKRFGVVLFTLLFVGVLLVIPCFADGAYNFSALDSSHNIRCYLNYSTLDGLTDLTYFYRSSLGYTFDIVPSRSYPYTNTFTFYNESENDYYINFNTYGGVLRYSINSFNLPAGGSVTVTSYCNNPDDGEYHSAICIYSVTEGSAYSVFNASGIIGNISNVFGMIFNSSTILLPLFLIGVTVSLGLVAVRFIRKVMWSN